MKIKQHKLITSLASEQEFNGIVFTEAAILARRKQRNKQTAWLLWRKNIDIEDLEQDQRALKFQLLRFRIWWEQLPQRAKNNPEFLFETILANADEKVMKIKKILIRFWFDWKKKDKSNPIHQEEFIRWWNLMHKKTRAAWIEFEVGFLEEEIEELLEPSPLIMNIIIFKRNTIWDFS